MSTVNKAWSFVLVGVLISIGVFVFWRGDRSGVPVRIYKPTKTTTSQPETITETRREVSPSSTSDVSESTTEPLDVSEIGMPPHRGEASDAPHSHSIASEEKDPDRHNIDSHLMPQALIEDGRRDLEWFRATKAYEAKFDALHVELDELMRESDALTSVSPEEFHQMSDEDKAEHIAKLETWKTKLLTLKEKEKELRKEKPVRPTPTHTH